jgi:hypothetical protein
MKANAVRKDQVGATVDERERRGHGDKLGRKAEVAIVALLAHPTMPEAARAAGISETTLWRWLQREDFQKRYREAQNKVFDGALGALQGATAEAVDCLRRNLSCSRPGVQVQAAKTILDYTLKARQLFDLELRIAQLEAALKAREEAEKVGRVEESAEDEGD